jgi:polar amino acid transport system permease protein
VLEADHLQALLGGLLYTWGLWGCALALALVGGLFVALLRLSPWRGLQAPALAYVTVVRGTPLLCLLLLIHYGLPQVGIVLPRFASAVASIGICYSAFISEAYRAGIESVDAGQTEAARALGLSSGKTMRFVVLPQAIRNILPVLGNESIALFKDTALAMVLGVNEMLMEARTIGSGTGRTLYMYTWAALFYLVSTMLLSLLQHRLERRYGDGAVGLRH